MGDSSINVTEGSGKRLQTYDHTVGGTLVQRQAVVLGEQPLESYVLATYTNISTATANSHLVQLMAGAGNRQRIRRIEMYQTVAATTATLMNVQVWRVTTAGTGGSTFVIPPLDASGTAVDGTGMSLPSSKGTEWCIITVGSVYMMQTIAASAQLSQPSLVFDFDRHRSKPLITNAGTSNGIVVKNTTAVAGASVVFNIWFDEAAW